MSIFKAFLEKKKLQKKFSLKNYVKNLFLLKFCLSDFDEEKHWQQNFSSENIFEINQITRKKFYEFNETRNKNRKNKLQFLWYIRGLIQERFQQKA